MIQIQTAASLLRRNLGIQNGQVKVIRALKQARRHFQLLGTCRSVSIAGHFQGLRVSGSEIKPDLRNKSSPKRWQGKLTIFFLIFLFFNGSRQVILELG
ncbi:MAG: hypothetical protein CVU59_00715 [Deltaproteobacteria bacterium HGW-Deltaproteobacteria-17]|nr:MAG: hypothetical protein CVU59_00715 [Deltaproteobacteria bacterium HGW-Deltaproteobacteria-17]